MTESLSRCATLLTVRDLMRYAVTRFNAAHLFFGHGCDNPWDEAAYLICHTLSLPLDRLDSCLDARLLEKERQAVLHMIDARVEKRVPAPYLTHEAWLTGHRFYVDERVIVPRSFIAELLEEDLAPWVDDPETVGTALDLCTGSGCLAILTALTFPNAQVDAVDISPAALEVATRNIADYQLGERVELLHSNLFASLAGRRYDLIISNPPYVNAASMQALPAEYQAEPMLALAGGEDGLELVHIIIERAAEHLNPGGFLIVEIGHNRADLEAAYPELPFVWLETASGNEFVFLLNADDLRA
jgi:ribosomal protein L3 glutamine methyltransferase